MKKLFIVVVLVVFLFSLFLTGCGTSGHLAVQVGSEIYDVPYVHLNNSLLDYKNGDKIYVQNIGGGWGKEDFGSAPIKEIPISKYFEIYNGKRLDEVRQGTVVGVFAVVSGKKDSIYTDKDGRVVNEIGTGSVQGALKKLVAVPEKNTKQ